MMTTLPINDPTISIKLTTKFVTFIIEKIKISDEAPKNIVEIKNLNIAKLENAVLTLRDIKWLKHFLIDYCKTAKEKVYIHELLNGAEIILPQPKILERNPELDARVKKLIAKQNMREYSAMTKNVDSVRKQLPEDTIAFQMKEINKQLIAVVQFIISVITGFVFGFIGIELAIGNLDFGFRLLLGIICALIVALAEIYFLAKKLNENFVYETPIKSTTKCTKIHQD